MFHQKYFFPIVGRQCWSVGVKQVQRDHGHAKKKPPNNNHLLSLTFSKQKAKKRKQILALSRKGLSTFRNEHQINKTKKPTEMVLLSAEHSKMQTHHQNIQVITNQKSFWIQFLFQQHSKFRSSGTFSNQVGTSLFGVHSLMEFLRLWIKQGG